MNEDISYQTVEELCDTVQRLAETIRMQEAENAQLRAILRECKPPKRAEWEIPEIEVIRFSAKDVLSPDEEEEKWFAGLLEEE